MLFYCRFAYIVFEDASEVESALKEKQGGELDGNALYLDHAASKTPFKSPRGGGNFGGGRDRKSFGGK